MAILKNYIISRYNLILLLLYLIPILSVCGFISYFGVNVPLHDQWVIPYFCDKFFDGTLTLKNLFSLHNSHRLFFPRIIFIALSFASDFDIRWELYFSLFLAIITFLALYRLALITTSKSLQTGFHLINISNCFLLFSWVQHENWLWGFQIALFLINFCLVLACLILSSQSLKPKIKLVISALLCGVASFSSAQGLLSWLALIPSVWMLPGNLKHKRKRLVIWIFLFLLSIFIYSWGYRKETGTVPDPIASNNKTLAIIHFFFNLMAAPFLGSYTFTWIFGLILVIFFLFLAFTARFYPQFKEDDSNLYPWMSLGLFSLLCSFLIAIGRSGLGADYAILTSRYTTHTILLPIAIIQLSQRIFSTSQTHLKINSQHRQRIILFFCTGILLGLNFVKSGNVVPYVQSRVPFIRVGKTCFNLIEYLDYSAFFRKSDYSCLRQLNSSPWMNVIWESAEKLKRLNFRTFPQNITFVEYPQRTYGEITTPQTDQVFNLYKSESVTIKGWVERFDFQNNPTLILFSINSRPSFFANTYAVDFSSQPFTSKKSSSEYPLEWEIELTADFLPLGTNILHAWIYDSTQNQFLKLNRQVNLRISNAQSSEQ